MFTCIRGATLSENLCSPCSKHGCTPVSDVLALLSTSVLEEQTNALASVLEVRSVYSFLVLQAQEGFTQSVLQVLTVFCTPVLEEQKQLSNGARCTGASSTVAQFYVDLWPCIKHRQDSVCWLRVLDAPVFDTPSFNYAVVQALISTLRACASCTGQWHLWVKYLCIKHGHQGTIQDRVWDTIWYPQICSRPHSWPCSLLIMQFMIQSPHLNPQVRLQVWPDNRSNAPLSTRYILPSTYTYAILQFYPIVLHWNTLYCVCVYVEINLNPKADLNSHNYSCWITSASGLKKHIIQSVICSIICKVFTSSVLRVCFVALVVGWVWYCSCKIQSSSRTIFQFYLARMYIVNANITIYDHQVQFKCATQLFIILSSSYKDYILLKLLTIVDENPVNTLEIICTSYYSTPCNMQKPHLFAR